MAERRVRLNVPSDRAGGLFLLMLKGAQQGQVWYSPEEEGYGFQEGWPIFFVAPNVKAFADMLEGPSLNPEDFWTPEEKEMAERARARNRAAAD